jgi:hypothetical protein
VGSSSTAFVVVGEPQALGRVVAAAIIVGGLSTRA